MQNVALEKMNHDSQKHIYILPLQGSCSAGRFIHKQAKKLPCIVGHKEGNSPTWGSLKEATFF